MLKHVLVVTAFTLSAAGSVVAQEDGPRPTTNGGAGIRAGNIAATGRTMPNAGVPRAGSGVTGLDRGIKEQDNKITGSICKGC